jgi:hypothetical protein
MLYGMSSFIPAPIFFVERMRLKDVLKRRKEKINPDKRKLKLLPATADKTT